jgi:membrane protease YdiL (CAAX protease family)
MVREYGRKGIVTAIFGYLGGYLGFQILIILAFTLYASTTDLVITNDIFTELSLVSTFLSSALTLGIFAWFFRAILRYDFLRFTQNPKAIRYIFGGFAGLYLVNLAFSLFYMLLGIEGQSLNQEVVTELIQSQPLFMAIPVVVFVPFIEEIVFRGALYELLIGKVNVIASVIITNVLFAVLHVTDIDSLIFLPIYFFLGVVLSMIYIYSGKNIWVSIAAHSLHNLLSVVAILLIA